VWATEGFPETSQGQIVGQLNHIAKAEIIKRQKQGSSYGSNDNSFSS